MHFENPCFTIDRYIPTAVNYITLLQRAQTKSRVRSDNVTLILKNYQIYMVPCTIIRRFQTVQQLQYERKYDLIQILILLFPMYTLHSRPINILSVIEYY